MKFRHLVLTLILAALLAVSAAAYQVPNLESKTRSPYYGMNTSQTDQADFLKSLGLFRGTDKGYELDRSMNRCETGTMLVRLLGKETEALEENNDHPFTDVPAWADPYVGWLWKNGLTKGMSETTYGAKKSVTAEQYLIFLSRVLQGSDVADNWWETGFGTYMIWLQASLDQQGFLRGDAVSLSVYALRNPTATGGSLAQRLLDEGVISGDVFQKEALTIFESEYSVDENHHLVRKTAGVPYVSRDTVTHLVTDGGKVPGSHIFALRETSNDWQLLLLDCATMDTLVEISCPNLPDLDPYGFSYQTSNGACDYFWASFHLLCWDGSQLTVVSSQNQPLEDLRLGSLAFYSDGNALWMQHNKDDLWLLDGAAALIPDELNDVVLVNSSAGCVFGNRPTASGGTEFIRYDPTSDAVTVLAAKGMEYLSDSFYRCGDELWQYTDGKLVQRLALPISDSLSDNQGGIYLLTHNDAGIPGIIRVSATGVVTTALSPDCGHGLEITNLDCIRPDGSLQFLYQGKISDSGHFDTKLFLYALEREGTHPAIRVVSLQYPIEDSMITNYSDPKVFYAEKIAEAQKQLNDLGLGIS